MFNSEKLWILSIIMDNLISLYNDNKNLLIKDSSDYINSFRDIALENFINSDIKTKENESYFNIESLLNDQFSYNFIPKELTVPLNEIFNCDIPELSTNIVFIINGWYFQKYSSVQHSPDSRVIICSFSEAIKKYPEIIKSHYAKYSNFKNQNLTALNTAFAQDGVFIYVSEKTNLLTPIQIINITFSEEDLLIQPRNLIVIEEESQAEIIFCEHTLSPNKFYTNAITEVFLNRNATLNFISVQNQHDNASLFSSIFFYQKAKSKVLSNIISLHGGRINNYIDVLMDEEHAENNLYGLYLADKEQNIGNFTFINHAKPNCTSNELFKGILDGASKVTFNGKIFVNKNAQKTSAIQSNKNILLSDNAKVVSKPQLEIYADDVKCSHGSAVGQLDENALFYLLSRGIPEKEARLLLLYSFVHEIIEKISIEPLKIRINELVEKRLRGELSRCDTCVVKCGR